MNQNPWRKMAAAGLALLLLSGCGAAMTAPAPTPTLRPPAAAPTVTPTVAPTATTPPTVTPTALPGLSFIGRFLVEIDFAIYALALDPSTQQAAQTLIASDAIFAALAPDKSYLLYYSQADGEARLHDMRTGETRTVIQDPSVSCLSWSPASTHFSAVVGHQLNIYDAAGQVTTVPYEPPSANYALNGTGPGSRYYGDFDCGVWLDPERLLFQRVASMPQNLKDAIYSTTTLVTLGENPTLEDAPLRLYVMDVCPDQNLAIIGDEYWGMYLAPAFTDFKSMQLRPLDTQISEPVTSLRRGKIGFVPGENCEIFYQNPDVGFKPGVIHIVNPDTVAESSSHAVEETMYITNWGGVWVGEAPARVIAILESSGYSSDGQYLSLVDLNTGARLELAHLAGSEMTILGWLP